MTHLSVLEPGSRRGSSGLPRVDSSGLGRSDSNDLGVDGARDAVGSSGVELGQGVLCEGKGMSY